MRNLEKKGEIKTMLKACNILRTFTISVNRKIINMIRTRVLSQMSIRR
jgi:hypothetical protein